MKWFASSYPVAITVGAAVVLSYTFLGGYLAVSWTDVIQGCLMLAALIFVPVVAVQALGGFDEIIRLLQTLSPYHLDFLTSPVGGVKEGQLLVNNLASQPFPIEEIIDGNTVETFPISIPMTVVGILSLMAWGLGYFGQPHILVRMMGIRSVEEVGKAKWFAVSWTFVAMSMAIIIGFIGVVYFQGKPIADKEHVFILMIQGLTHPLVAGLLLAAIMAAIMSTADSQLLVASSALTADLVRDKISEKQSLFLGRFTVVVVAIVALFLAWDENSKVLEIVSYAWAGLGASIGSVMLMSLLWSKTTYHGGIAGVIVGGLVTVAWNKLEGGPFGIFNLYELLPAFICAVVAIVVVSLLARPQGVQQVN